MRIFSDQVEGSHEVHRIPLGQRMFRICDDFGREWIEGPPGAPVYALMPFEDGEHGSTTILISGETGSGKSVITRSLIAAYSKVRPVYVFDWAGRDHYFGMFANRRPKNLAPGSYPMPVRGYYFYYPVETEQRKPRKKLKGEIPIRPYFGKYTYEQLESIGFSGKGPQNLHKILRRYGPFKDMETFNDFIENFPTSSRESSAKVKLGRKASKHNKPYQEGDIIRSDALNSLIRDLNIFVLEKNIWEMNRQRDLNVDRLILSGKSAVFSYNDLELAKAEISYFFNRLQTLIDRHPEMKKRPPFVFVEEAHKVFDRGSHNDLQKAISSFIHELRKLGIGVCLTMPTLAPLDRAIAGDIKEWILGKMRGENKSIAMKFIEKPASIVSKLMKNKKLGIREFLYFPTEWDRQYPMGFIMRPYECPQEYERKQ